MQDPKSNKDLIQTLICKSGMLILSTPFDRLAPESIKTFPYPEQLCGLVLVAPSLDPDLEKPRWYNKLATSPLVRWMIPNKMQLSNEEVMVLEEGFTKMLPLWRTIKIPKLKVSAYE
jgi:hypothetical protein